MPDWDDGVSWIRDRAGNTVRIATLTEEEARDGTGSSTTLAPSNGVDDTAVIQAALDAARLTYAPALVKGLPGENYLITTIVIGSWTTLDMTGCKITQITGTDTNMVQNWGFTGSRTIQDANITAGDTTLTSETANFGSQHDENNVRIWGADPGGGVFENTIQSVTNSTTVELYTAPTVTVVNGPATIGQWDLNILIMGGLWDRGNNGRLFQYEPGHEGDEDYRIQDASGFGILFRRAEGVTVKDVMFTGGNANTCTALCFGDITDFHADNIGVSGTSSVYLSGLIQATGPARFGHFSNIYGRCTDDLAALLPVDWLTGVRDVYGDIAHVTMENIHSERCDGSLVIMVPGSEELNASLQHIYIRNVYGRDTNETQHQGGLVSLADTGAFDDMANGFVDDIVIENVSGEPMGDYPLSRGLVWLGAENMGRIRLTGLNIHSPTGMTRHGVIIGPNTNIGYLSIGDSVISSIDGGCDLINYDEAAGSAIQNIGLSRNAYRVNGVWQLISDADAPTYEETVLGIPDLLLYWRLGEPSGGTANDSGPNNLDGTITSGTLGATGLIANDVDTAWTGNGTSSKIDGPTIPAQAEWTIVWWEKSNGVNADYAGIFSTPGDRIDIARVLGVADDRLYFYDGSTWVGGGDWTVDATPTMLALSFDGTDIRTWKNGAQVNAVWLGSGRSLLNAAFTVGGLDAGRTIDTIDEFAIYSRALDAEEIAQLYTVGS